MNVQKILRQEIGVITFIDIDEFLVKEYHFL